MTVKRHPMPLYETGYSRLMTESVIDNLPEPTINLGVKRHEWFDLHAALDQVLGYLVRSSVELPTGTLAALLDLHRYIGVEEAVDVGEPYCRVRLEPLLAYVESVSLPLATQLREDMTA